MPDSFDLLMDKVRAELAEATGQPQTPAELTRHDIASRLRHITSNLDDLIALSRDFSSPDIQNAIAEEERALGAVLARAQLLASFIDSRKPAPRLVWRR